VNARQRAIQPIILQFPWWNRVVALPIPVSNSAIDQEITTEEMRSNVASCYGILEPPTAAVGHRRRFGDVWSMSASRSLSELARVTAAGLTRADAVEKVGAMPVARNNRIVATGFLNRSCAFDACLESMLLSDPLQNPFSTASTLSGHRWLKISAAQCDLGPMTRPPTEAAPNNRLGCDAYGRPGGDPGRPVE